MDKNVSDGCSLKAGAGKAPIDLDDVLPHDGFDAERHGLYARAVVVEDEVRRACILTLEVTSIAVELLLQMREMAGELIGCEGPYMWVVPTHTFSAPHVRTASHLASEAERERNERYRLALMEAARAALGQAMDSRRVVTLCAGEGTCPVNVSRDVETPAGWWLGANLQGFADHAMPVLVFKGVLGETVAVVAAADVQSSVLDKSRDSEGKRVVSGDLFGFAAQALERDLGCVALLLPGAAGDQAPKEQAVVTEFMADGSRRVTDAQERAYRMLHKQGHALACALTETMDASALIENPHVEARTFDVELSAQERADFQSLAPRRRYEFVPAGRLSTTVYLLRLGAIELVGVQPEVASAFGSAVRAARPGYVLFATLVNGGQKYLPDPDAYQKITYEAMNSGFAAGAHERLLAGILAALDAA